VIRGFLKTAAPFSSDLVLVVEMGMGAALLAGTVLARRGQYCAHAWERAHDGEQIVNESRRKLSDKYGRGFSRPNYSI